MYRVRSTDVWFNAPGIQAAYQPVAAPDPLAARQNVGDNLRMDGRYTAVPGVAPTWSSAAGWTFNGGNQYLNTNLAPVMNTTWSMFCHFDYTSGGSYPTVCGARRSGGPPVEDFLISADDGVSGTSNTTLVRNGKNNAGYQWTPRVEGVVGFSGLTAYLNGKAAGTLDSIATLSNPCPIYVGCMNRINTPNYFFFGSIKTLIVLSVTLSPAHIAQYSRQMAYAHVNPDWSAWGRRRRYYYAPAAMLAAMRRRMPGEVRVGSRGVIE